MVHYTLKLLFYNKNKFKEVGMRRLFVTSLKNPKLTLFSLLLVGTITGIVAFSFWVFTQSNIDNYIGYGAQLMGGVILLIAKLAYSSGVEEKLSSDLTYNGGNVIWVCDEDVKHHVRFLGTGSFPDERKTPTPVEAFEFLNGVGILPNDYLDSFPPESAHYEEIQEYKRRAQVHA